MYLHIQELNLHHSITGKWWGDEGSGEGVHEWPKFERPHELLLSPPDCLCHLPLGILIRSFPSASYNFPISQHFREMSNISREYIQMTMAFTQYLLGDDDLSVLRGESVLPGFPREAVTTSDSTDEWSAHVETSAMPGFLLHTSAGWLFSLTENLIFTLVDEGWLPGLPSQEGVRVI